MISVPTPDHASTTAEAATRCDILVAGAGAVGLALAVALARSGFSVVCIGPVASRRDGRTVALLDGSLRMLRAIGAWRDGDARSAPLEVMRIVDDTGSLLRGAPLDFRASEIGLEAFGRNIENADLVASLVAAATETPGLTRVEATLDHHVATEDGILARTDGGAVFEARLLVGAEGATSPTRLRAGIASRAESYDQTALTVLLAHAEPHRNVSTEFHTRQGPFTLVPLPAREGAPHRSSLVWVMAPYEAARRIALPGAALAAEIERQSRFMLGAVRLESAVGKFPIGRMMARHLVGPRVVLAGEAAHALPPIGAQGLNLSFRDAATLVDNLAAARRAGRDPGAPRVLAAYERARIGDVALRSGSVDALNRSLMSTLLPVDLLRGAGLMMLAAVPPLRRAVMREGLRPQQSVPVLMR